MTNETIRRHTNVPPRDPTNVPIARDESKVHGTLIRFSRCLCQMSLLAGGRSVLVPEPSESGGTCEWRANRARRTCS